MYTVTIYDKSKKYFKTYEHIHTIKYFDLSNYQLIGDYGNYSISKSIIGSIEVEREI